MVHTSFSSGGGGQRDFGGSGISRPVAAIEPRRRETNANFLRPSAAKASGGGGHGGRRQRKKSGGGSSNNGGGGSSSGSGLKKGLRASSSHADLSKSAAMAEVVNFGACCAYSPLLKFFKK